MKKQKVLITGTSGFIGSHLAERLVKEGYEVSALLRKKELMQEPKSRRDSLELLKELNVQIVWGDLLDKESLKKALSQKEFIFHLAAIARPMAIPNELYFKVNEEGTKNLLDACKNVKSINKIIVMSSVSAVGPTRDGKPVNEETKCQPVDIYGWSKLAKEKVVEQYVKAHRMPILILRPPMVFGPRDFEMLRLFKAVNNRFFPINGKVKGTEYLYVENLVEACILAMKKGEIGESYHVANGEHYSINEIINSIEKALSKKILPIKFPTITFIIGGGVLECLGKVFNFHPPFKHDTVKWMTNKYWYSDISKIQKELGYIPIVSLDEGTKRTVRYYREKGYLK